MIIPEYLNALVDKDSIEETTFSLKLNDVNAFEVFYVGSLEKIDDALYITSDYENKKEELPISKIMIREQGREEMHMLYDGFQHGYSNMFCDEHDPEIDYEVKQLELDGQKLFSVSMTLGYGIDYEDEKEDYEVDDQEMVEVMNRPHRISWTQVKEEGYDWLTIQFANAEGKSVFVDEELA